MTWIKDFYAKRAASKERRAKRAVKRRTIWKTAPLRLTPATINAQLTQLWGLIILLRHRKLFGPLCRICGVNYANTPYHIVPKQRGNSVKWDLDNGCGSCGPCNNSERINRSLYQDVRHPAIFGSELIARLKEKARLNMQLSMADKLEMRERFKRILETGDYDEKTSE